MKKILLFLLLLNCNLIFAQKYTERYIKDANKVAEQWLNNIDEKKYKDAYYMLSREVRNIYPEEYWIDFIKKLMLDFGVKKDRVIVEKSFKSEIEGLKDGFYVFIKYNTEYKNTKDHSETIVLKQNDNFKWKVFNYDYNFTDEDYEGVPKSTQPQK